MIQFFEGNPHLAVAMSGGVDSSYLAYRAVQAGCEVRGYLVRSAFQPAFEIGDAQRMAGHLGIPLAVADVDVLCDARVAANGPDRCYHCKRKLFTAILEAALRDGFSVVADGSNASDDDADRPGMKALAELGVRSPLRECGLTKARIRAGAREAGLFTHDKPAYACLATRIPTGMPIDAGNLRRVEEAEKALFNLGFSDFRVRVMAGGAAKIQVTAAQFDRLVRERAAVVTRLAPDFQEIVLDLRDRKEST